MRLAFFALFMCIPYLSPTQNVVDTAQLVRYANLLWALLQALFAVHALVGSSTSREELDILISKQLLFLCVVGTRLLG